MIEAQFLVPIKGAYLGNVDLWIPGRPHPKARPRSQPKGKGQPFNSGKNRKAEGRIRQIYLQKYGATPWFSRLPFEGPVLLTVYLLYERPATKKSWWEGRDMVSTPDVDNPLKTVMDALNGTVWVDDSQVIGAHVEKFYWPNPSGTYVHVQMYEPTMKGP